MKKIVWGIGALSGLASIFLTNIGLAFATTAVEITKPPVAANIPSDIALIINSLLTLVFIVAFLIAFFFLVFGGVRWIISGGDKQATQSAREMITAALVGVAIIAFSWALIILLQNFFGISILKFTIPGPGTPPNP